MREIPRLEKKAGTALVLSGGATKAYNFHLGVLKVLRDEPITSIIGSSAGAIVGAFIAYGATVDDLITILYQDQVYLPKFDKWVRTLTSSQLFQPKLFNITKQGFHTGLASLRMLLSLPTLLRRDILADAIDTLIASQSQLPGFFDAVALEDLYQRLLPSNDFKDSEIDLYVTATTLDSSCRAVFNHQYEFSDGENVFMTDVPVHRAVRASSAVPGMFEPVKIKDRYYIDGEVKQTLSADIGVSLADRVIISHTYQPLINSGQSLNNHGWVNVLKQSTVMVFHERIKIWQRIYREQNPDKEIVWIHPEPDDEEFFLAPEFSFKPEIQKMLIDRGEAAARKALAIHSVAQTTP